MRVSEAFLFYADMVSGFVSGLVKIYRHSWVERMVRYGYESVE